MNPLPHRGPFYKRPGAVRTFAPVLRSAPEEFAAAAPPLVWRTMEDLRRTAEDLGIEPARLNRRELLEAIRDSLPRADARALGLLLQAQASS